MKKILSLLSLLMLCIVGVSAQEDEAVFSVAGNADFLGNWELLDANDMVKGDDGLYTKTYEGVTLANGFKLEYKVVKNHSWDENWGKTKGGDNADFTVYQGDGTYNVTFTFNPDATFEDGQNVACVMVNPALELAKDGLEELITKLGAFNLSTLAPALETAQAALTNANATVETIAVATAALKAAAKEKMTEALDLATQFANTYGYNTGTLNLLSLITTAKGYVDEEKWNELAQAMPMFANQAKAKVQDALEKIGKYAETIDYGPFTADLEAIGTAITGEDYFATIAALQKAAEDFLVGAQNFIDEVKAINTEGKNNADELAAALAAAEDAMASTTNTIVNKGDAIKELVKAYRAFLEANPEAEPVYTVVGGFNDEGEADNVLFGKQWVTTLEANDMVKGEDGVYTWTKEEVELDACTILYKVVKNHAWDETWGFADGANANYVVNEAGKYNVTVLFNPEATFENGFNVDMKLEAIAEPVDPFASMTIDPAAGEVTSLKEFTLTFEGATTVDAFFGEGIDKPYVESGDLVFDGDLGYGFEGNDVTITLFEEVTAAGEYTLVIPAGIIEVDGVANEEMKFEYTIVKGETTFEVFVKNVPEGFGTPWAYAWSGEGDAAVPVKEWPGDKMQMYDLGEGVIGYTWQVTAMEAPQYIIFSNGKNQNDGGIQTENLAFENRKVYDLSELLPAPAEPFDYEKIAIDPEDHSTQESLQNFTLTFGGQEVTVNAEVKPTIGEAEGEIVLNEDGSVSISFAEAITAPGDYTLDIPEGAILYNGEAIDPLSFVYTIAGAADFTIDPAPGVVESLENFTVTFSYYIEAPEATAYLFNRETEEEIPATVYEGAGKSLTVMLSEPVTTPGEWQLNIEGVTDMDGTPIELIFDYTIKSSEPDMSYYILGDFWGWDNLKQMDPTDNENIYTLVVDVTVEAQKYEYKLRQGSDLDNWDVYQLPASGNYEFIFGTEDYPAGDYTLTFTANIGGEEIDGIPAYTVVLDVQPKTSTGINAVNAAIANGAVIYNLQGVRVEKAYKGGLYIVNGKKVVMK